MRKLIVALALLGSAFGGVGAIADPGPHHGNNAWGLCNAWSHNGGGNSHNAPPFQNLQDTAEAADQTVEEWCAANGQKPGGGNGNGNGG